MKHISFRNVSHKATIKYSRVIMRDHSGQHPVQYSGNIRPAMKQSDWLIFSLRSKRSRTKRTKFGQRVLVFRIRDARKMGREQKGGRKWVGEGNGAPDWCGVVILIDKCIKFA